MTTEALTNVEPSKALSLTAGETSASAVAAASKATIEARFMMALARPRDVERFRVNILKDCKRPGFAEHAVYELPVGRDKRGRQQYHKGPSIRFAEAALRHFGNLYAEQTIVYEDKEKVLIRITVTDLETNSADSCDVRIPKTVERRKLKDGQIALEERTNSWGDQIYIVRATAEEIHAKAKAAIAKEKRNLIKEMLPFDIVEEAMAACEATITKEAAEDPDFHRRRIIDGFADMNVLVEDIEEYLGKTIARVQPKEIAELKTLWLAMKEGSTTWDEIMEDKKPKQTAGTAKNELEKQEKPKEETAKPPVEEPPADETPGAECIEADSPPDDTSKLWKRAKDGKLFEFYDNSWIPYASE